MCLLQSSQVLQTGGDVAGGGGWNGCLKLAVVSFYR